MFGSLIFGSGLLKVAYDMISADNNNAKADRINLDAFEKIAVANKKVEEEVLALEAAMARLINRKKGILSTSMCDFLELYSQIIKIDFQPSDGINELDFMALQPSMIEEIKNSTRAATEKMTTSQEVVTFIFSGISGVIAKESKINLSNANMRDRQADVQAEQAETICIALDAKKQRAERMSNVLAKLNVLFRKSILHTKSIIDKNGTNRLNYSEFDKKSIMSCLNCAKDIKIILDAPLLDNNGEIANQSLIAIQTGEKFLSQINQAIN